MAWHSERPAFKTKPASKEVRENFEWLKANTDNLLASRLSKFSVVTDDNSLPTAIADAGADPTTIVIQDERTLTGDVTVPANVDLWIPQGGMLSGAHTITINGSFDAGLYQVFSGDGRVIGNPLITKVPVNWFDSATGLATNIATAINKALLFTPIHSKIYIPRGDYNLGSTITPNKNDGSVLIKGDERIEPWDGGNQNEKGTSLHFTGTIDTKMFDMSGTRVWGFEDIYLDGRNVASHGVFYDRTDDLNMAVGVRFTRVVIQHNKIAGIQLGDYTNNGGVSGGVAPCKIDQCILGYNYYNLFIDSSTVDGVDIFNTNFTGSQWHSPEVKNHIRVIRGGKINVFGGIMGNLKNLNTSYAIYVKNGGVAINGTYMELCGGAQGVMYCATPDIAVPDGSHGTGAYKLNSITDVHVLCEGIYAAPYYPTAITSSHFIYLAEGSRLSLKNNLFHRRYNTASNAWSGPIVVVHPNAELVSIRNTYIYDFDKDAGAQWPWIGSAVAETFGKVVSFGDIRSQDYINYYAIPSSTSKNIFETVGSITLKSNFRADANSIKTSTLAQSHYDLSEENILLMRGIVGNGWNSMYIGGGNASLNAVTDINFYIGATATTLTGTKTVSIQPTGLWPGIDNTFYLGKNDDDTPFAWKGVILKDTTNGKYYRIEVINGVITATDLTD